MEFKNLVTDKFPLTNFVPCRAHSLSLVVNLFCKKHEQAVQIVGKIQIFYFVFASSKKIWETLIQKVKITLKAKNNDELSNRWAAVP
jgi:hypothetical protein